MLADDGPGQRGCLVPTARIPCMLSLGSVALLLITK